MEKRTVIKVDNISKSFKLYLDKGTTLKDRMLFRKRSRYENRKVLDNISFEVKQGEAIGIIGQNGCGKSTMLKLLSGIMYPDSGTIRMDGRISALIELGAGFHPDLSGRENIYTNAAIFGLSKKEIDERLQTIIDFSELGEYIENPVRTYSSGMYMRLAFSVAINVDADILLVDEILAVGDAAFQAKCFNKMREIKANGTTIVIVSHSLGQIEQICDRSIWIADKQIKAEGKPFDVHSQYLRYMGEKPEEQPIFVDLEDNAPPDNSDLNDSAEEDKEAFEDSNRWGDKSAIIETVRILDHSGKEKSTFQTGEQVDIEINYKKTTCGELNSIIGIGVFRNDGLQCYGSNTLIDRVGSISLKLQGSCICKIAELNLLPGEYTLDVALHKEDGFAYDYWRQCKRISMYSDKQDVGSMRLVHTWEME